MFRLFKRSKMEDWEVDLLRNVLIRLPSEYSTLLDQVNNGLFRGVLLDVSDIPGYVAFTFHSNILKIYNKDNERDFKLTNIKVFDNKLLSFVPYEVYVSSGTISGYSLVGSKKNSIDVSRVDVSCFKKVFIDTTDYFRIMHLLNEEERNLLNPSDVYSIVLSDKEFFHLKELEDGDFIGMDENKIIYKITHDPNEAVEINKKLSEVLKNGY
jgi:hypothetical protein